MHKLGITLPHLGGSQIGLEVFESINTFYPSNYLYDILLFYENVKKEAFTFPCAAMACSEMFGYDGTVIATNLNTAEELSKIVTVKRKVFYVYDLDWVYLEHKDFETLTKIYQYKDFELYTRCDSYAKYLENAFNVKVHGVLPKFDLKRFIC